jgi:hypothetical protein
LFSEPDLRQLENSAEIFNALSDIPGDIEDVDHLLEVRMFSLKVIALYTAGLCKHPIFKCVQAPTFLTSGNT